MTTPELVYYVAQSLDGYIADQDEKVDWLDAFGNEEEDFGYNSFYENIDSLVMGSSTYEFIERYGEWPYPGKPSWVLSGKNREAMDPLIRISDQSPADVLREIRDSGFKRTWLVGGGKLATSFLEIDAITEYIITIIPVLLGSGLPLLAGLDKFHRLTVNKKTVFDSGVVQLHLSPVTG